MPGAVLGTIKGNTGPPLEMGETTCKSVCAEENRGQGGTGWGLASVRRQALDIEGPKVKAHLACWRKGRNMRGERQERRGTGRVPKSTGRVACGPVFGVLLFALHEWLLRTGTPSASGPLAAASSKSGFRAM